MKTKILSALLLGFLLVGIVSAFGVASPYWGDNPLKMEAGSTEIVPLNLQNMVGDKDVTLKAEIIEGAEIATLQEDTYTVLAGTSDTIVPLKIKLPKDSSGANVVVEFKSFNTEDTGMVALGTGMVVGFEILPLEPTGLSTTAWVLIILAVILIVWIIIVVKRKNNKKR